jgi:replicative DNA helicase
MKYTLIETKQLMILKKMIVEIGFRIEATSYLQTQDFTTSELRAVYQAIKSMMSLGIEINPISVAEKAKVDLETIMGVDLLELDYNSIAKDISKKGNEYRIKLLLKEFLSEMGKEEFNFDSSFQKLQDDINKPIEQSLNGLVGEEVLIDFLTKVNENRTEIVGKTGIEKLDALLEGFERGHIYSFVAASGVGKSMLGIQILEESMRAGNSVMYVTNEMSSTEVTSRLIARNMIEEGVTAQDVRRNKLEGHRLNKRDEVLDDLLNIFKGTGSVIFEKGTDPVEVIKAIRYYVYKTGVKLVIVDHIHNFSGRGEIFERISLIAHMLQNVAIELNIAMVILGQMSLNSMKSVDIETVGAKGAMDLNEVSNVFAILNRKKIADGDTSKKEENPNNMHIIVTKNRDGKTGATRSWVHFPAMKLVQDND